MAVKRPTKTPAPQQRLETYGCPIRQPPGDKQLFWDRWAFANCLTLDEGAPLRIQLFKRISDKLVPEYFEWHEWTEKQIRGHCDHSFLGLAGCSGSAKTRNAVGFACVWWLAYPEISSVIFCSTTIKALRKRGWAEVQAFYTSMAGGERHGNFVDSRMMWQNRKGDDRHAIFGIAVEEGSTTKAADHIKGIHTERQLVIVDEFTAVGEAIVDACVNLSSYPKEFLMVGIGNPRSHLDQHGRWCEPLDGWGSINLDTEEWESTTKVNGKPGWVIRFDAEKSPNIKEGEIVSKHLPKKESVEARRKQLGGENSPSYWSNDRGFWPPEGVLKTIFSESSLVTHDGYGKHKFTGRDFQIIGAFDPAYGGGDRAVLRFAKLGEIIGGKWGIESLPPIEIQLNANDSNPIHYQLTEKTRRECERKIFGEFSCPPNNLGVDDTGPGGVCDIIQRTWSHKIIRIEFGGSPSSDSVGPEDFRLACDVYHNKVTEMWHMAKLALEHGQLRGIDKATAVELCNREVDDSAILSGKSNAKIKMMPKKDYRAMFGKSPDLADTLVMLLEVARLKGFRIAPIGETVHRGEDFEKGVEATQSVYEDVAYREDEPSELVGNWEVR